MNINGARELFEAAVKTVLDWFSEEEDQGSYRDAVDKYLDAIDQVQYETLVVAINMLQVLQQLTFEAHGVAEFSAQKTLKGQVRMYVKALLVQECQKEERAKTSQAQ